MNHFAYDGGELYAERVPVRRIAERYGTPCYIYSRAALEQAYQEFSAAFSGCEHLVCYAVKANSSLALLNLLARLGSGFDIVSGGELQRVLAAGGDPARTVFSGVGKTADEMRQALAAKIFCFNVESESELLRLDRIAAESGATAAISLRVNPDVDPRTHPYIATGLKQNKFGVSHRDVIRLYRKARELRHLSVSGIGCHIGSQLTELAPFIAALDRIVDLMQQLAADGIPVTHVDLGGGLGIRYRDESPPPFVDYARALMTHLGKQSVRLLLEPGRALVGNAGILLTRVEYLKQGEESRFAVVDAAMNDLMRPALYDAYHEVRPVAVDNGTRDVYEIVGPVCESGDFLAHARTLALHENDLLAIMSAGAYGMSMSSNYNSRPRAAEVLVDNEEAHLIRAREMISDLIATERMLP